MQNENQRTNIGTATEFIRQKTLLQVYVPFSAATLWRLIGASKFPKPVKVTDQISAWRVSDVEKWARDPTGYSSCEEDAK